MSKKKQKTIWFLSYWLVAIPVAWLVAYVNPLFIFLSLVLVFWKPWLFYIDGYFDKDKPDV